MLALGTPAPDFELPEVVSGRTVRLADYGEKRALLVMFICRHCPYVKHVQAELARIGRDYQGQSLGIVAISSNDVQAHPEDAPEKLREMAEELGFNFAFCYDATQEVARAYQAACTPDFFLFDDQRRLAYRGELDDSRPRNQILVSGNALRTAIQAVLKNRVPAGEQKPSLGCNIKWRESTEGERTPTKGR